MVIKDYCSETKADKEQVKVTVGFLGFGPNTHYRMRVSPLAPCRAHARVDEGMNLDALWGQLDRVD